MNLINGCYGYGYSGIPNNLIVKELVFNYLGSLDIDSYLTNTIIKAAEEATAKANAAAEKAENLDVIQLQLDLEAEVIRATEVEGVVLQELSDLSLDFDTQKLDTGITVTAKFGGIERTQAEKNSDIITSKDFGILGDGSDETTKLNDFFKAAENKLAILNTGKTLGYSAGLTISNPLKLITNDTAFKNVGVISGFGFTITADDVQIDNLNIYADCATEEIAKTHRGLWITSSNIKIGKLSLDGNQEGIGASTGRNSGVLFGADLRSFNNVEVGKIISNNWDYPIIFNNVSNFRVGILDFKKYRRGIYLKDSSHGVFIGGVFHSVSKNIVGSAGENAILMESVEEHLLTSNISINNVDVKIAGEHGFRLGGQKDVSHVWFNNCSVRNSGLGFGKGVEPDNHGGCGFKLLGATSLDGHKHSNIWFNNCTVENIIIEREGLKVNYCGFQVGKCSNVFFSNCSVLINKDKPHSEYEGLAESSMSGIEIIGSDNVYGNNIRIEQPRLFGIYIYTAISDTYFWDENSDIHFSNLYITSENDCVPIHINSLKTNTTNVSFKNVNLHCKGRGLVVEDGEDTKLNYGVLTGEIYSPIDYILLNSGVFHVDVTTNSAISQYNYALNTSIINHIGGSKMIRKYDSWIDISNGLLYDRLEPNEIKEIVFPNSNPVDILTIAGPGTTDYAVFHRRYNGVVIIQNGGAYEATSTPPIVGDDPSTDKISINSTDGVLTIKNNGTAAVRIYLSGL